MTVNQKHLGLPYPYSFAVLRFPMKFRRLWSTESTHGTLINWGWKLQKKKGMKKGRKKKRKKEEGMEMMEMEMQGAPLREYLMRGVPGRLRSLRNIFSL